MPGNDGFHIHHIGYPGFESESCCRASSTEESKFVAVDQALVTADRAQCRRWKIKRLQTCFPQGVLNFAAESEHCQLDIIRSRI